MSYATIATIALDPDIRARITACAAQQGGDARMLGENNFFHRMAASPDWSEAYESALAANIERPGWSDVVITDGMILAAVQPLIAPPE